MYEPVKNLGQNFLTDYTFVNKMVEALDLKGGDAVVEIGPGLGVLTERISRKLIGSGSVIYAIELDERFVSKLESMFIHDLDLHVVHADILKWLPDFEFNNNYIIGKLCFHINRDADWILVQVRRNCKPCCNFTCMHSAVFLKHDIAS